MSLKKCIASQWIIHVDRNAYGHQYDVKIIFERSGEQKPISLSENNNNHFKALCRKAINGLDAFKNLQFVYDGRGQLWTPEALKEDIQVEIAQGDLNDFLKLYLVDPNGTLHISLTKGATIMMSDFSDTVNAALIEDRSWRNLMELILSEDAITRDRNPFVIHGSGCLYEVEERPFNSGLVYREGHTKGVHIIGGKNGIPQMALAMDCCKKVFFPSNANFLEFFDNFMKNGRRTFEEVEAICWGLGLYPKDNRRQVLRFKSFTGHDTLDGEICAVMKNSNDVFPLKNLQIIPDQSVQINAMSKDLKEMALNLNKFKPHDRKRFIEQQFQKLQLNNKISSAFGVTVKEQMLEDRFEDGIRINVTAANNVALVQDDFGAFKLDCRNYYRRGSYKKIILLATKNDSDRAIEGIKKVIKFATSKSEREVNAMLAFQEFDTTLASLTPWINALTKFKGIGNLVITVDESPDSHAFLKFAEAVTGVNTQHLKLSTASNVKYQTMQNIVHKLNIKMGGLNHVIKFSENLPNLDLNNGKTFVIGLDVCHPTGDNYKGETDEPSFGGIAANYLEHPQEFGDLCFAHASRKEVVDQRPLIYFTKKLLTHVKQFRSIQTIVLIRDGVSEGQYSQVISDEVQAIKEAARQLSLKVKIVVFIVTKNGNVRHFHESEDKRIQSMPPRSFVNFGTRFGFQQFYMTAHRSHTGTAKTIMITKIVDEVGISLSEAQEFLLGLTYLHQIVSLPISLPTPINQADAIAQRGQNLYRILKKYCPAKIPRNGDGSIDNKKLTELLSINNENLPISRYNA